MGDDAGGATEIRTFLIADVRGYTRFTQQRGDEAGARLAARFAEVVRDHVGARGGTVVELRGDEALCTFGSPRSALRAAVELQRRCAEEIRSDPTLPLRVGIGIDAGEAVPVEGGYRGGALNLAARLCSIAGPGEVLVSDGIVHLARRLEDMSYVDRGRMELKGLEEPVHVMQVRFELDMPAAEKATPAPRRWTPVRLASVAVVAIAVVAAAVTLAASRIGGHPAVVLQANAVGVLDSAGHVTGQVPLPLGGRPGGVAAGAGSIWASDAGRNAVVQIDPHSRSIVDTIPGVGAGPTGIAVGGGAVWVANSGGATVAWINAHAPSTATPFPIGVGQGPGPIAYGAGAAWVVNTSDGTLQRIDPDRHPSRPVPIGTSPAAVTVGSGSVWVTDTGSSSIVRIDPGSMRVTDRLTVGNDPVAVASGGGYVWVANAGEGTVTRIDPASDRERGISVGGRPSGLAYLAGAVWVATGQPARVARIDPDTLNVAATPVASEPQAVTGLGGQTWFTALSSPASHRGGTLRVVFGSPSPFTSGLHPFDPGAAPYAVHVELLNMTNDGLVALRRVGGAAGGQVVPDLAVAPPTVSADGRTYSFRLRRGIRYSTGIPVRASDFRFAVERQFLYPVSYGARLAFSNVVGASVCTQSRRRCAVALAKGIQTHDDTGTITINLERADPAFLFRLATSFGDLLPPGSPRPDSGKTVPATGPYMVTGVTRNGFLLVRNPHFRQWSADAQPAGLPDRMRWSRVGDAGAELSAVERGSADVMVDEPPSTRFAELQTTYSALAHPFVSLATEFMSLNTRVPPFDNVAVRRAVNLAVDRRRFAEILGGPLVQTPTCQVLPPTMLGYRPYCPYTADPNPASGAWSAPDLAKARRLVRSTGTRGERVDVWACTCIDATRAETAYLASVFQSLGYRARARLTGDYNVYSDETGNSRTRGQTALSPWFADFPYPTTFFDALLTCRAFVRGDPTNPNTAEFCDPKLDALVRSAEREQAAGSPGKAAVLWQASDREAVDQAPWVPLTNVRGIDVTASRVGNYQHNPQLGVLLDQLWVT